ncbi:MAG: polysaccharide biosynthesis/export family protein [Myxococcota bacterium]
MRTWIGWMAMLLLLGCTSTPEAPRPPPQPVIGDYRIQPGDEIDVRFALSPELNVLTVVRPDGRVSLKLVGEVLAEGRTPAELSAELKEVYSRELRDPEIAVIVRGMAARIYVDGHIEAPGEYSWNPQITALQAIALAGGFRSTADEEHIIVLRRGEDGVQQVIDIERDEDEATSDQDVFLAPYDLVVVPSTGVADVNKWVDQYIRQNIPISPRDIFTPF